MQQDVADNSQGIFKFQYEIKQKSFRCILVNVISEADCHQLNWVTRPEIKFQETQSVQVTIHTASWKTK